MELMKGRPADCTGRLEREVAVYDLLDKLGIEYERTDHEEANTMEACEEIDRVLGTAMCKNLFLCNRQKTSFYLLLLPGNKPFKTKVFSKMMGVSRLSFAPPEKMEEYLHISPGAVSPMGLVFESAQAVTLVMDEDVKKMALLGCHPCVNTSSIAFTMNDFFRKFLPATGHAITFVDLPWETE